MNRPAGRGLSDRACRWFVAGVFGPFGLFTLATLAPGAADAMLPPVEVASADAVEVASAAAVEVNEAGGGPRNFQFTEILSPCQAAEAQLVDALDRVRSGDWLATDEAALVAGFLLSECGWLEVQTVEGVR